MNFESQFESAFNDDTTKKENYDISEGVKNITGYIIAKEFRGLYPPDKVFMKNGSKEALQMNKYFQGIIA